MRRRSLLLLLAPLALVVFLAVFLGPRLLEDDAPGEDELRRLAEEAVDPGRLEVWGAWEGDDRRPSRRSWTGTWQRSPGPRSSTCPWGTSSRQRVREAAAEQALPALAILSGTRLPQELAEQGLLLPLDRIEQETAEPFGDSFAAVGGYGDEEPFGVMVKPQNESLVWHAPAAYEAAEVEPAAELGRAPGERRCAHRGRLPRLFGPRGRGRGDHGRLRDDPPRGRRARLLRPPPPQGGSLDARDRRRVAPAARPGRRRRAERRRGGRGRARDRRRGRGRAARHGPAGGGAALRGRGGRCRRGRAVPRDRRRRAGRDRDRRPGGHVPLQPGQRGSAELPRDRRGDRHLHLVRPADARTRRRSVDLRGRDDASRRHRARETRSTTATTSPTSCPKSWPRWRAVACCRSSRSSCGLPATSRRSPSVWRLPRSRSTGTSA